MNEHWSSAFAEVNGLRIHYHRTGEGSGKPPLVLLHGYTDNGLCWSRVARGLEGQYDVILPDARGHGQTEGPVEDMSVPLLAADAAGLIRALGLEGVLLFGHSMGAMTALAVAAEHPALVRAAVLEDPPFRASDPYVLTAEDKQQMEQDAKNNLLFHALPLAVRVTEGRAQNPGWHEEEILPWAESKGEYNPEIVRHRVAFRSYSWRKALARMTAPLLLVTADPQQGAITTPAVSAEAAAIGKTLSVARIPGAGHCIHRDRYEDTMRVVRAFLETTK